MPNTNKGFIADVYKTVDEIISTSHASSPDAVVITPTVGTVHLSKAIESVAQQDFKNLIHLIVVDGVDFADSVRHIVSKARSDRCIVCTLPFNTGKNGMNGHRIYATFPLLVNAKYVLFLDEDNWWAPEHVSSLIAAMESAGADWSHSMRKIYTHDEIYIADDNCESIGMHEPFSTLIKGWPSYIDTNCYAFKRNAIAQLAHCWYHPLRADRHFFHELSTAFPNYASSKKYTTNYRLKKDGPVTPGYIIEGNKFMIEKYQNKLPWL